MSASTGISTRAAIAAEGDVGSIGPELVMGLINAHRRSKVLFAAVELGVIDALAGAEAGDGAPATQSGDQAGGQPSGLTVEQLAQRLAASSAAASGGVNEVALCRLLQACVGLGVLRSHAHESVTRYALTPVAREYLASSSPHSLAGYVIHCNRTVYPLFQHLDSCIVTGENAWQQAFGMPGSQVFQALYKEEQSMLRFMKGMHSFAALSAKQVLSAFDLSHFRRVVDMGGATGAFMTAMAALYPNCHCTVVDLPHVVSAAQAHFTKPPFVTDPGVLQRVSWLALDFFEAADGVGEAAAKLPEADLYLLTRILHDWDEARCLKLLHFLHGRMAPGAALLIGEMLLPGEGEDPSVVGDGAALQDINMLVQTHGRERTAQGYFDLLSSAGFDRSKMQSKRTGVYLDAVLVVK